MKKNKKTKAIGLGSGLSSLLGEEVEKKSENFKMVPIEFIKPGPWQPRKIFDKIELESLSSSIKKQGIARFLWYKWIELLFRMLQGFLVAQE